MSVILTDLVKIREVIMNSNAHKVEHPISGLYSYLYKLAYAAWKVFRRYCISETHGAQVIVRKQNKVLLVRASYRETLCFPGGYIKSNEEPIQAAKRELEEETGLMILETQFKFCKQISHRCDNTLCKDSLFEVVLDESLDLSPSVDGKEIISAAFYDIDMFDNLKLDRNVSSYFKTLL